MLKLDHISNKKLVIARQIFQNALIQSGPNYAKVNKALAVIGFDLTIETILKIIILSLDSKKTPKEGFDALIQQTNSLLQKAKLSSIPNRRHILDIHKIRNRIQHEGRFPIDSEVEESRIYCKDFFQEVLKEVWGISLDKISLSNLIINAEAKTNILEAEKLFLEEKYDKSVERSAYALYDVLDKVKNVYVGREPSVFNKGVVVSKLWKFPSNLDDFNEAMNSREIKVDEDFFKSFNKIQETLLFISLGMNYSDYIKLRGITGHIYMTMDGKHHSNDRKENISANEAEFVVNYCSSAIYEIESRVGDILKPFGKDYYEYL